MRQRWLWFAVVIAPTWVTAGDWPHWRGPDRNDAIDEASDWDAEKWKNAAPTWSAQVGEGSSSPIVVGDRLYAFGWKDDKDHVTCLDAGSGHELWQSSYSAPQYARLARGDEGLYSGPCSTLEFDTRSGLLFSLSSDGDLNCWNTEEKGQNVWTKNLYDEYHAPVRPKVGRSGHRDYGYTSSPLVQGDLVIVEVGASSGNLIAFDKRTGKEVWKSENKSPAGHTGGPVPLMVEGVPCLAVHNFAGLLVVRTDPGHEGKTVATVPWVTDFANNIATAAVFENNVVITSSYNQHRIARFRITLSGGAEEVWEAPVASKVCSPLIHNGFVYWAWEHVYCLDFETGAIQWHGGETGDAGSMIATNDQRLVLWSNRGTLSLLEGAARSPEELKVLATRDVFHRSDAWPHVVLSNGRLFCKDRTGEIVCIR